MPQSSYTFNLTPTKVKMNTSNGITVQASYKRIVYDGTTTKYWIYYLWPDGFDESDAEDFNGRTLTPSATLSQTTAPYLAQCSPFYNDGENSGNLRAFFFRIFEYDSATAPHTVIANPTSKEIFLTYEQRMAIKSSLSVEDVGFNYAPDIYKLLRKNSLATIPYCLFTSSYLVNSSNINSNPLHNKYTYIYKDESNIYDLDDITDAIYEAIEGHPVVAHMDAKLVVTRRIQPNDSNAYYLEVKKYDYVESINDYESTPSETRLIFSAKTFDYPNLCTVNWFYSDGTLTNKPLNLTYTTISTYAYLITKARSSITEKPSLPTTINGRNVTISYSGNPDSQNDNILLCTQIATKTFYLSESEAEDYDAHNINELFGNSSSNTIVITIDGDFDTSNITTGNCGRQFILSSPSNVTWDDTRTPWNNLYINSMTVGSTTIDMTTFVAGRTLVPTETTYSITTKTNVTLICASVIKYTDKSMISKLKEFLGLSMNSVEATISVPGSASYSGDIYLKTYAKCDLSGTTGGVAFDEHENAISFANAFTANPTKATSSHYLDDDSTLASLLQEHSNIAGNYLFGVTSWNATSGAFSGDTDQYYLFIWGLTFPTNAVITTGSVWNEMFSSSSTNVNITLSKV